MKSLWQSKEWKTYQEALGREVRVYEEQGARAQVIIDRTAFGLSTWEIPRGPVVESGEQMKSLLEVIMHDAKNERCMALYCSPKQLPADQDLPGKPSNRHIYPEATRILDLGLTDEELLKQMKPKGRYNIKVAQKHGVTVEQSEDIDAFYKLLTETSERDQFAVFPKHMYQTFLQALEGSFLLLAYSESHEPIGGLLGAVWGSQGFYYYGASAHEHRAQMGPYLLQWEAMQYCRGHGCNSYDLLGVAPPDTPDGHPWKGITTFKEKFGGELVTYPPEREVVLRPMSKMLLQLKRRILG